MVRTVFSRCTRFRSVIQLQWSTTGFILPAQKRKIRHSYVTTAHDIICVCSLTGPTFLWGFSGRQSEARCFWFRSWDLSFILCVYVYYVAKMPKVAPAAAIFVQQDDVSGMICGWSRALRPSVPQRRIWEEDLCEFLGCDWETLASHQ